MLTHMHVGVALLGAAIVAPHDWQAALLAGIGGFLPDCTALMQRGYDRVRGRKPFERCGKAFFKTYDALHSMLLMLPTLIVPPLAWGVYSHLVVDALTHERRVLTDGGYARVNSYCWPLQWWLPYFCDCNRSKYLNKKNHIVQHAFAAALFVSFAALMW